MSVKVMGYVWDLDCNMSPSEKLVLLAYADHASHEGINIFPSIGTITRKTNLSERTVQRCTQSLIEKELLIKEGQHKSGTNLLRIPLPDYLGGDMVTPHKEEGVSESQEGVSESQETGDTVTPDPSLTIPKPSMKDINLNGGVVGYISELLGYKEIDKHIKAGIEKKQIELGFSDAEICQYSWEIMNTLPALGIADLFKKLKRHPRVDIWLE